MSSQEWQEHWAMRKKEGYPCTKRSQRIAQNQLARLDKEGFQPQLLLNYATDRLYRSFHRWPECLKPRPVQETARMSDLVKSDPEKAAPFIDLMKQITSHPPVYDERSRKLELFNQVRERVK